MPKGKSLVKASEALRTPRNIPSEILGPIVSYQAEIAWIDGLPTLVSAPVKFAENPKAAMQALLEKCLDLPYDGKDPSLLGLTQGEAVIVNLIRDAAGGDQDARAAVLDRLLGKPQQNIKAVHLSGDLNEFLDRVAAETKTQTQTIDVTPPSNPNSAEDL